MAALSTNRKSKATSGYRLEISINSINIDYNYKALPEDNFCSLYHTLTTKIQSILSSNQLDQIRERARSIMLSKSAEKLSQRKDRLLKSPKIFFNEKLIYRVPQNEQDTVLLFIKLVSMNKVPLHYVNLLEYNTVEGTDALGDLQIFKEEPKITNALIEFENQFSKFIIHGHSIAHVDCVICWEIDKPLLVSQSKKKRWLYFYKREGKSIPVINISKFSGLKIKEI